MYILEKDIMYIMNNRQAQCFKPVIPKLRRKAMVSLGYIVSSMIAWTKLWPSKEQINKIL